MPGAPRRGWPGRAGPCPSPSHRRSRRGEAGVSSTGGREAARPESARLPVWGSHLLVRLARPRCAHSTPLRSTTGEFSSPAFAGPTASAKWGISQSPVSGIAIAVAAKQNAARSAGGGTGLSGGARQPPEGYTGKEVHDDVSSPPTPCSHRGAPLAVMAISSGAHTLPRSSGWGGGGAI